MYPGTTGGAAVNHETSDSRRQEPSIVRRLLGHGEDVDGSVEEPRLDRPARGRRVIWRDLGDRLAATDPDVADCCPGRPVLDPGRAQALIQFGRTHEAKTGRLRARE